MVSLEGTRCSRPTRKSRIFLPLEGDGRRDTRFHWKVVRIWSLLWNRRNGDIHSSLVFGGISLVICGTY